jgi:hypothetical protein
LNQKMANGSCTNELCVDRETQLRLVRLREELLTNFNTLLIDRIRFLEQTINRLSLISPSTTITSPSSSAGKRLTPETIVKDQLPASSSLRRSSSATAYFLQSPVDPNVPRYGASARSCPSSVDLTSINEQRKYFFSNKKLLRTQDRTSSECNSNYLSIPIHRQWANSTSDLPSSTTINSEKGRLESRRFACDVDDNDVRAFKAMIYMEQARKQHARPLTRLRQALGISSNSSTGSFTPNSTKKRTNS